MLLIFQPVFIVKKIHLPLYNFINKISKLFISIYGISIKPIINIINKKNNLKNEITK
jgi:hypothetical protein